MVSSTRDTAASAMAGPVPTNGPSPATRMASRTPAPEGRRKTNSPEIIAIAIVPMVSGSADTLIGVLQSDLRRERREKRY